MLKFENDITLFINCITLLRHEVQMMGQHIKLPLQSAQMLIELDVNSKHKLSWNTISFYGLNTQWFHVEFLQENDATFERHPWWLKVLYHESYNLFPIFFHELRSSRSLESNTCHSTQNIFLWTHKLNLIVYHECSHNLMSQKCVKL